MSNPLQSIIRILPPNAKIADFGCGLGGTLLDSYQMRQDLELFGYDKEMQILSDLEHNPIQFTQADFDTWFLQDDEKNKYDLVISEHTLEHLNNSFDYFSQLVNACKVGGYIYVLTPSDRATWFSYPKRQHENLILSFWDDPTHKRPYTPQALYRMGVFHNLDIIQAKYNQELKELVKLPLNFAHFLKTKDSDKFVDEYWRAIGWTCFAIFRKHKDSYSKSYYFSMKGLPHGNKVQD